MACLLSLYSLHSPHFPDRFLSFYFFWGRIDRVWLCCPVMDRMVTPVLFALLIPSRSCFLAPRAKRQKRNRFGRLSLRSHSADSESLSVCACVCVCVCVCVCKPAFRGSSDCPLRVFGFFLAPSPLDPSAVTID